MEITGDKDLPRKLYTLLTDSPEVGEIDEFVDQFAIWQGPALAVDRDLIRAGHHRPFLTRLNFSASYGHRYIEFEEKPGKVVRRLLPDLLWHMPMATRVKGLTFKPGEGELVEAREGVLMNQWSGYEIDPCDEPCGGF